MINSEFYNKNIFVTGATSGIGLQIANTLNSRNSNLIITGRKEELLSNIAKNFKKTNYYQME